MNINIYYGGRGLIEDPTLYVVGQLETVFNELNVNTKRYNLHEIKNEITTLPQTLKDADGVVLAVNVEWFGIGWLMQSFLDACWMYADKDKIKNVYMLPVVISTTYGEQESAAYLKSAWELIGGKTCQSIAAYIDDALSFEINQGYKKIIEDSGELLYRCISQKRVTLPSSNAYIKKGAIKDTLPLTPQESEQLSKYVADDSYVKTQKQDIEELASMFKGMLSTEQTEQEPKAQPAPKKKVFESFSAFTEAKEPEAASSNFIPTTSAEPAYQLKFKEAFSPQPDFKADYSIEIEDIGRFIYLNVDGSRLYAEYAQSEAAITIRMSSKALNDIINGNMTFQQAFMVGAMKAKGNFSAIRMLDSIFTF